MAEATGGTGAGERGACAGGRSGGGAGETKQGRAHGTAGGGGGAGTYSEPDTDEESEEESEWEEEGEHGAWEDGPPRAAAPERDKQGGGAGLRGWRYAPGATSAQGRWAPHTHRIPMYMSHRPEIVPPCVNKASYPPRG